jgi:hypothetical protein
MSYEVEHLAWTGLGSACHAGKSMFSIAAFNTAVMGNIFVKINNTSRVEKR